MCVCDRERERHRQKDILLYKTASQTDTEKKNMAPDGDWEGDDYDDGGGGGGGRGGGFQVCLILGSPGKGGK